MKVVGEHVEVIKDEKTGEKIEKTFYLVEPDPPEYKESIAMTIFIPEDNRKPFYTIGDIIKIAGIIFLFSSGTQKSASKSTEVASSNTRSKTSGKYDSIRKHVSKQLKGKEDKKDSSRDRKAKLYSYATVEEFLQTYENQRYFLDISIAQHEKRIQELEEEERILKQKISKTTVRECEGLRKDLEKKGKEKTEELNELKRVKEIGKPLTDEKQEKLKETFLSITAKTLDNFASGSSIDFLVNEYKKKFLIQFLIESLIEVDETLLIHDLEHIQDSEHFPSIEAVPADIDAVHAPTIIRMADLHNYYKGKVDLAKFFEAAPAALQKPKSTFKD